MADGHERIETNVGLMVILVLIVSNIGGLVTILPLFSRGNLLRPVEGSSPIPRFSSQAGTCTCAKAATCATRR